MVKNIYILYYNDKIFSTIILVNLIGINILWKKDYPLLIDVLRVPNLIESNFYILTKGIMLYAYKGNSNKYRQLFDMLYNFINFNKYTILGDTVEIYKIDVYGTSLEDEYVTQVQIPVLGF